VSLNESKIDNIPQGSPNENVILTAPYSEEEARKVVF
jgi:hypothetical protein